MRAQAGSSPTWRWRRARSTSTHCAADGVAGWIKSGVATLDRSGLMPYFGVACASSRLTSIRAEIHVPALGDDRLSRVPRGADRAAAHGIVRRAVAQHDPADWIHDAVVSRCRGGPDLPSRPPREPCPGPA